MVISDAGSLVAVAIVAQIGTLATIIVTALMNRRKIDAVKELVDGHSTKQTATIEQQTKTIQDLSAAIAGRRNDD